MKGWGGALPARHLCKVGGGTCVARIGEAPLCKGGGVTLGKTKKHPDARVGSGRHTFARQG